MKVIILAEDDDPTGELDRARASFRGEGFGEPEVYAIGRNDGRMNLLQLLKLWRMCGDYEVEFKESDYFVIPQSSSMMKGYAEGWVGGVCYDGDTPGTERTIYVGVAPDGSSHT